MPKTTRVTRWRTRRGRSYRRGTHMARRVSGALALVALFCLVILIVGGGITTILIYGRITSTLPDFDAVVRQWEENGTAASEPTTIFAWQDRDRRDAVAIYELRDPLPGGRRWLTLEEMPQSLIDATIAFEDPSLKLTQVLVTPDLMLGLVDILRQRVGVSEKAPLVRRVIGGLPNLAEWPFTSDFGGFTRFWNSIRDLLLSHRASDLYSRDQILEWYLNTTYFGKLAFGAEAAARVYFDKPLSEISLSEAAAIVVQGADPTFDPFSEPGEAGRRQEAVLAALRREGLSTEDALEAARLTPLQFAPGLEQRFDVIAPHFALFVQSELEKRFTPELLLYGGLQVYTTLELDLQRQAECVAKAHVNRLSGAIGSGLPADEQDSCAALTFLPSPSASIGNTYDVDSAALIALDAETSGIRAMVGSLNFWDEAIHGARNMATEEPHQPGSILKPVIYLAALSQGYTAATMVLDIEMDFRGELSTGLLRPLNEDLQYHGPMRLREALGNGYEVPAVQVMSWVGVEKVLHTARSLGMTGLTSAPNEYGLALAQRGGEATLLDLVYAYNVMNNMGVMLGQPRMPGTTPSGSRTLDPVAILRVQDGDGQLLYGYEQPQRREILTPQLAFLMNDMLSDRSARCAAYGCPNVLELPDNRPAAVATGTAAEFHDVWTIGYTPQLAIGVWLGNSDGRETGSLSGTAGAAPIWQSLMSWAMDDEPVAVWTQPPDLVELAVCNLSGLLATPFCPTVSELFIAGTQPTVFDQVYQEFAINRETGRLATIHTPPELVQHRVYRVLPAQAAEWGTENGYERPPSEYDTISEAPADGGMASITWPPVFATLGGSVTITGTASGEGFDYYRLAFFEGLAPSELQLIASDAGRPKVDEALGDWDVGQLDGLYTLLLTVVRQDGSFSEVSVPVTIDNTPPSIEIISPFPGQRFPAGSQNSTIGVRAVDNLAVKQVRFYVDEEDNPFAASADPPFTIQWRLPATGCRELYAVAVDAAGNETRSDPVPICVAGGD